MNPLIELRKHTLLPSRWNTETEPVSYILKADWESDKWLLLNIYWIANKARGPHITYWSARNTKTNEVWDCTERLAKTFLSRELMFLDAMQYIAPDMCISHLNLLPNNYPWLVRGEVEYTIKDAIARIKANVKAKGTTNG